MKIYFSIVALLVASSLSAQSLKDSLFSGKLKNPLKQAELARDSAQKAAKDSMDLAAGVKKDSASNPAVSPSASAPSSAVSPSAEGVIPDAQAATTAPATATVNSLPDASELPDSLNRTYHAKQKAWKRYIDQQTTIISAQADETRKVRTGEYYVEFDYQIGLNGRVKVSNITCSPQNEFIVQQVTDAMTRTPVLAAPIYADGKPRIVNAKQQMTILKKK